MKSIIQKYGWGTLVLLGVTIITTTIAVIMGIYAIQTVMKSKLSADVNPAYKTEIYILDANGGENLVLRNFKKNSTTGVEIAQHTSLSSNILTLHDDFIEDYGQDFTLKIYNYNTSSVQVTITSTAKPTLTGATGMEAEIDKPSQVISAYSEGTPANSATFAITNNPVMPQTLTINIEFKEYVPQYNLTTVADLKSHFTYIENINVGNYYTATSVVFDYWDSEKYSQFDWDSGYTNVGATTNDDIRLFVSGTDYYVLSESQIMAPESCEGLFNEFSRLESLHFYNFNTSNVTNMSKMFRVYSSGGYDNVVAPIQHLDLSNYNTTNVTDMGSMFFNCSRLTTLDLSSFNTTNVTDMSYMFQGCNSLETLDLSSFNTTNVMNMSAMFSGCSSLTTIYVGDAWSTTNVSSSNTMFHNCTSLVGNYFNDNVRQTFQYTSTYKDKTYAYAHSSTQDGYLTHIKYKAQMDALAS